MKELARRFPHNPILRPSDVTPSRADMEVTCLLNPGAFEYEGRIGLLVRVAERPLQEAGWVSTPIIDADEPGGVRIVRFPIGDCDDVSDARVFTHQRKAYLTTLSHLRLAWSDDGENFTVDPQPTLIGAGPFETFGIEDARVTNLDGVYHLTYTAVSDIGYGVGLIRTTDWKTFDRPGLLFPPPNKDCALFPEKIGGLFYALHRPTYSDLGAPYIWISSSPDMIHWGDHRCIARTRPGEWDSMKLGAGAEPIRTEQGWLEIYHGVAANSEYSLGLLLMDLNDPRKVIARSALPVMRPVTSCETTGFFGNVVFTNGHVVQGDTVTVYYGAADEVICGARFSLSELLDSLAPVRGRELAPIG